jgi:hypothetical protein
MGRYLKLQTCSIKESSRKETISVPLQWSERDVNRRGTYVRVVHGRDDDPEAKDDAKHDVYLGPPRRDERRSDPGNLTPVETEQTTAETRKGTKYLIENDVV